MDELTKDGIRDIEQIHSNWIKFEVAGEDQRLLALCADDIELRPPDAQPLFDFCLQNQPTPGRRRMIATRVLTAVLLLAGCAIPQAQYKPDAANVIFIPAEQLHAAVLKAPGGPGLTNTGVVDIAMEDNYSIEVVRRTAPSLAELHKNWTDIWYVIDGKGTVVTGGSLTESTEPHPGEIRGRGVSGGTEREIGKGDVLRISHGVPHWVSKIDGGEIVYMVVKVSPAK